MKKKKSEQRAPAPGRSSTPSERVLWLLNALWNGNRSEMARSVGVTHSVLTKIAAGQQNPGRRLLAAVASHPKVNPGWLLSGEGEPILADSGSAPEEGWPVPIANQVLPGQLSDHRSLLTGESFPVAGAFYRQSRYWLKVMPSEAIAQTNRSGVEPYDLLLMETDRVCWTSEEMVDQKICVVRVTPSAEPKLGVVTWDPGAPQEPSDLGFDSFERDVKPSDRIERITILRYPGGRLEAHCRPLQKMSSRSGANKKTGLKPILQPASESIRLSQILGVSMLLVRR